MKSLAGLCVLALLPCAIWAQSTPKSLTTSNDVQYFRYLLNTLGNPEHDPELVKMQEEGFIALFGLNEQEAALLRSAALVYKTAMTSFKAKSLAITSEKASLSSRDRSSLKALAAEMDRTTAVTTEQMLNSVRPEVASRLRAAGDAVARATGAAQEVN